MAKTMEGQILVAGSLAFDNIMSFPGYFKEHILPEKLHMINISFLVDKVTKQRGGCAANIAYTLSLLGRHPRIIAAAGNDFDTYADFLEKNGVDTSAILRVEDEITATCYITTDRANNQITGFYVGAMPHSKNISVKASAGPSPALLIVAPDDPEAMLRHCREAKEAGIPLIYDPSFQVTAMEGGPLLEGALGAHAMILNDYEFSVFQEKTGRTTEQLLDQMDMLVVTLGEKGSRILRKGETAIEVPPCVISKAVDPTGAGDAYRGGFVAGLVAGCELAECGRMGSVAAAYVVEKYGTQNHSYTRDEFADRYRKSFGRAPSFVATA
ncbi:MAG: carbohydrate kinase family protein [Vulcanimicrobiota bacterium]